MIDEPSLGLAPLVIDRVYAILAELRAQAAITIVIVEQNTRAIADIADRIHVCAQRPHRALQISGRNQWHDDDRRRLFRLHDRPAWHRRLFRRTFFANFGHGHFSDWRGVRRKCLPPMPRDIDTAADPDALVVANMLQETD